MFVLLLWLILLVKCVMLLQVVHPIFDGSFYLDATHKLRLKEEFGAYCLCGLLDYFDFVSFTYLMTGRNL